MKLLYSKLRDLSVSDTLFTKRLSVSLTYSLQGLMLAFLGTFLDSNSQPSYVMAILCYTFALGLTQAECDQYWLSKTKNKQPPDAAPHLFTWLGPAAFYLIACLVNPATEPDIAAILCLGLIYIHSNSQHRKTLLGIYDREADIKSTIYLALRSSYPAFLIPGLFLSSNELNIVIKLLTAALCATSSLATLRKASTLNGGPGSNAKLFIMTIDFLKNQSWVSASPLYQTVLPIGQVWLVRQVLTPIVMVLQLNRRTTDDKFFIEGSSKYKLLHHPNSYFYSGLILASILIWLIIPSNSTYSPYLSAIIAWMALILAQDIKSSAIRINEIDNYRSIFYAIFTVLFIFLWILYTQGAVIEILILGIALTDIFSIYLASTKRKHFKSARIDKFSFWRKIK